MDDVQRAANKANELSRQTLGLSGSVVVSVSSPSASGSFVAIQVLSDTTITSLTAPGITNGALLQTTLAAGTIVYGDIRAITISNGLLIAYKA
jgi:hypothetical protein